MSKQTATAAQTWSLDPTHSEVQFKVRHLVISTVTGYFRSFRGSVTPKGEGFDGAKVDFSLDVASIDTNVADRDAHLKSDDFFNTEAFPHITFQGEVKQTAENTFKITGPLTIRDFTHEIELDAELGGIMVDPYGNTKAGFEANGKISRKAFGLKWNATTEAGGVVVADEVKLHFNVQVVKG